MDEELFGGQQLSVWMSHGDQVQSLPPDYQLLAASENAPIAAFKHVDREWYGLQFHPEVTHTEQGQQILHRFVREIAGCSGQWTADNIVADTVARLRRQLGSERVLLALSGGVDSTVAAALLQQAVGRQLVCVFVDNGLLRENEVENVRSALTSALDSELHIVDAGERFFSALQGVTDPEDKRRVIGNLFIEVFEAEAARFGNIRFLAQGTIYPDRIESAGAGTPGQLIKSHHNVGGLPERMKMELIEPLSELFKDEVRSVGRQLGLPEQLIGRHPFPGPGLGVRVLGEVRPEYVELLRKADSIFIAELRAAGWYDRVSQAFAVFLPVHSVGVTGDTRRYGPVIALRAVETTDFMTASCVRLPDELLANSMRRIVNELPEISRVVYDISDKPPATIEWE